MIASISLLSNTSPKRRRQLPVLAQIPSRELLATPPLGLLTEGHVSLVQRAYQN